MSGAADLEGVVDSRGLRAAIVAGRFHRDVVERLVEGALAEFGRGGGVPADVGVHWVDGSFELPVVLDRLAATGGFDALVALGCIVRGETPHFDHVATAATTGCEAVARTRGVPVGFGVLTVDDHAQAMARAGGAHGDKGAEAMHAALSTARVLEGL
jgi:6,7-dimethyl-8-ribityllumazine synthase